MSTNLPASPILSAFIAEAEDLRIRLLAHVREHVVAGHVFQGLTAINKRAVSRVDEFCAHFGEGDRPVALSALSVDELIALLIGFGPLPEEPFYAMEASTVSAPTETLDVIDFRKRNKGKTVRVMTGERRGDEGTIVIQKSDSQQVFVRWNLGTQGWCDRSRLCIVTAAPTV